MAIVAGKATVVLDVWHEPIPVSERMPEEDQFVLAFYPELNAWKEAITIEVRIAGGGGLEMWIEPVAEWCSGFDYQATHWLPLPPKPE